MSDLRERVGRRDERPLCHDTILSAKACRDDPPLLAERPSRVFDDGPDLWRVRAWGLPVVELDRLPHTLHVSSWHGPPSLSYCDEHKLLLWRDAS